MAELGLKLKFGRLLKLKSNQNITNSDAFRLKNWMVITILTLLVGFSFFPSFSSEFLPWDDYEYVKENPDIKSFSPENIKKIFSNGYQGNYQPITMLSYMADDFFGNENPGVYHFTNLVFHLLNAILVFFLTRKILKNDFSAFAVSALFAVHPIQAESAMWIAERKNMVYTFFFLSASIFYLRFNEEGRTKYYLGALVLFVFSLLSKGLAVAFPLCLIAFDLIQEKKFSIKNSVLKVPFFLLAIASGLLTMKFQESGGFLNKDHDYDLFTKIVYAGYAFTFYVFKLLIPIKLSAYYPYPEKGFIVYMSLLFLLVFIFLTVFLLRKNKKAEAGFLLFFFFNIVFVLQFIPFGEVLVAERYNYISSIGILLFIFSFAGNYVQLKKNILKPALIFTTFIITLFSILSFQRSKTWKDSFVFYEDILKKFPQSYVVMNSLGAEYMRTGDFRKAEQYFDQAKKVKPDFYSVYYNEGLCFLKQDNEEKAFNAFSECLKLKPYYKCYFARASILERIKNYSAAINDLDKCIELKKDNARAFYLRALCTEEAGNPTAALNDYNAAIRLKPDEALFYLNRAIALGKVNMIGESLKDLDTAISLKKDYGQAYYLRAVGKYKQGANPCEDLKTASGFGIQEARQAYAKICGGK